MLNKAIEDLTKEVATFAIPIIDAFKWKILEIAQATLTWIQENRGAIQGYITFFGTKIKELWDTIVPIVKQIIEQITTFWRNHWETIKTILVNFYEIAVAIIKNGLAIISGIIKTVLSILTLDFKWAWQWIQKIIVWVFDFIADYIQAVFNVDIRQKIWDGLLAIIQAFTDAFTWIKTGFTELVDSAKEWGWNMIQMLMDGIMEKWNSFKDTVAATSQVLADFLGFHSPTKKGAGKDSDKWMPNLINMLAIGLNEWKSVIEWKAKLIAESLASIGVKFKQSAISETLIKIADTAKWKFDEVINSIQGSVDKIKTLKTELEDINKTISDLTSKKWEAEKGGKMALANRALEIEKEISTLKADTETIGTEEWQKKLLALQEELTFANSFVSAQERAFAFSQASRSESQIILANMQEQMMAAQNEIYRATELAEAKKVQIKEEEELHKTLMQTKTDLDAQYFLLFNDRIEWVKNGIMQTIKLMQSLNAMSWWGGGASLWARAIWGTMMENQPYLVGERGPEIVIPKSSSTVVPNNEVRGGGMNVSINFGDISVRNDWDIREITRAVEDSLTRKLQLYRQGIA